VDARRRLLAPGGALIPTCDVLWATPVECAAFYERHLGPAASHGVTLDAARAKLCNMPAFPRDSSEYGQVVADPAAWAKIDYAKVEVQPISGSARWRPTRPSTTHGVLLWFEARLGSSQRYETGPWKQTVYSNMLLPFERPLDVEPSDTISVDLWVGPGGEPWAWTTTVANSSGRERVRLKQSSLLGAACRPVRRMEGASPDLVYRVTT
jgi:hypothetical protein